MGVFKDTTISLDFTFQILIPSHNENCKGRKYRTVCDLYFLKYYSKPLILCFHVKLLLICYKNVGFKDQNLCQTIEYCTKATFLAFQCTLKNKLVKVFF